MPAIILAYANDKNESLKWLKEEFDAISNYFHTNNQGEVEVISLPAVEVMRLKDVLASRADDIIIFHFSGHADQYNLYFSDEHGNDAHGLAQMLGIAPNLKLVFLNGCATKDHVDLFH